MNYELFEIEKQLQENPAEIIAHCEEHYFSGLETAAEAVLLNRMESPVVLLAGPSGSGKTTSGLRLKELLSERGVTAHLISMDNYFRSWDAADFPRTADNQRDLESPLCLDIPLLNEHFSRLCAGEDIAVPVYDFPSHSRVEGQSVRMDASLGDVFIFEGIHALNPLFTEQHPEACRVYVAPESGFTQNGTLVCPPSSLRLMRRLVRDYQFRGAAAEYSLQLWGNVVSSEKLHITPYQTGAHAVVDTTLGYELGVLRPFILPLIEPLPREVSCRAEVDAALAALSAVTEVNAELVPDTSILREFIGTPPAPSEGGELERTE